MILTENIDLIVDAIKNGDVVALPTDGVFGLFCEKDNISGINKIYNLKRRNWNKKLCVYQENLPFLTKDQPLIGMTYIYNNIGYRSSLVQKEFSKIVEKTGPLIGTSCNLSGHVPITHPKHVPFDILTLNVSCEFGIESTIFSLDNDTFVRSGLVESLPIKISNDYFVSICNDKAYDMGYNCQDLARNFWFFINENNSINFDINCTCYICNLLNAYLDNMADRA